MIWSIEAIKRVNLVEFLSRVYGLEFRAEGRSWAALSPFTAESDPSFCVWVAGDGHWLFKDWSAGVEGTVFDAVQRLEGLPDFTATWRRIEELLAGVAAVPCAGSAGARPGPPASGYDVAGLYELCRRRDATPCRQYLLERGLSEALVDGLIRDGTVVLNEYQGRRWCGFAVRGAGGELHSLYNRQIDGDGKRLLGPRHAFSLDWARLATAPEVALCEGIIDYLSLKTLEGEALTGLALLGNQVGLTPALLPAAQTVVAAFDADAAGEAALAATRERFADRQVRVYDLDGSKDPNDLLLARQASGRRREQHGKRLSLSERVAISTSSGASRAVAEQFGVHHSSVCELRGQAQEILRREWEQRRPGPAPVPAGDNTPYPAVKSERDALRRELDLLKMRRDWLELQLQWYRQDEAAPRSATTGGAEAQTAGKKKGPVARRHRKNREWR